MVLKITTVNGLLQDIYLKEIKMEIKAELLKPYTEEQRLNFIIEQNHQQSFEIRESEDGLQAWGYTDEEIAQQEKEQQRKNLIAQLDAIDLKCIRALRAIQAGTGTEDDTAKLAELEEQAEQIRQQIKEL